MARVATTSAERHAPRRKAVCVGADVGGTWIRIAVWAEHRVATTVVPADRDLQQLASVLRAVWRRRRWSRRRVDSTDRKSTRLNSSHANISYAVFCLKKKKTKYNHTPNLNS